MTEPGVPPALRAGRRALDLVDGVTILGDWWWHRPTGRWVLPVRLRPDSPTNVVVPAETDWFVLVDPRYPHGGITFLPAKQNGLTGTFPHQHYNKEAGADAPWRLGDICLEDFVATLGRAGLNPESEDADGRLRWRTLRALAWLAAAANGQLLPDGAPFELPDFLETSTAPRVVFNEGADSFACWQASELRWGIVEVFRPSAVPNTIVVQRFHGRGNQTLVQPAWGPPLTGNQARPERGTWLRLSCLPVLAPWQAPATWGELRRLVAEHGDNLDALLRPALASLRDGREHVALIGFPIPRTMGEPTVHMHWQAVQLPVLCRSRQVPHGFRPNEIGQWHADRQGPLHSANPIHWLPSENWNAAEIAMRGRFPPHLAEKHVAIIGAGTLGSAVAELLVRAGVLRLTLVDLDTLEAGNLVRHTLLLSAIGEDKAAAVATRLQLVNPNAHVDAITETFPPAAGSGSPIQLADIVIDTTGSNEVTAAMADYPWSGERLFLSLSIGLGARRLYFYAARGTSFPNVAFRTAVEPLVAEDYERYEGDLPWEGSGCWHPVFPARSDDIWLLAAASVKRLEGLARKPPDDPVLRVIEQLEEKEEFSGVRVL